MSSQNLENLSIQELKKMVKNENKEVKKLQEEKEKQRLILAYKKLQNKKEKLLQEKKNIKKPKFKTKSKSKNKKTKTFEDYYQDCIKGKDIPKDAPEYLKKALLKAKKEYEKGIILTKSGLNGFAKKYDIEAESSLLPKDFFKEKASLIKDFLRNNRNTKVKMILVCMVEKESFLNYEGKKVKDQSKIYLQSGTYINLEHTDVKIILKDIISELLIGLANYQEKGSGWYFKEIIKLELHLVEYKPMRGSTYIKLPEFIKKKNAILNMENKDDKCFLWCILRYLHPKLNHGERISDLKKYQKNLNLKKIKFPIQDKDITKFENYNPNLPGINVFSVNDNNIVYPLRINEKDCQKSIDLFFHLDGEKQHYSLIKNFSRLVRSQKTKDSRKIFICKKCFTHFIKEDLLEKHILYCVNNETVLVKMPTNKHKILKFKHCFKKLTLPFVIYADFECFTVPVNSCQPNPEKSYTTTYQKHEPSGFCLYLKGVVDNFEPIVYTKKKPDEDISKEFVKRVVELTQKIYKDYYQKPKPYNLTKEEERDFQSASFCHICEEELSIDKKTNKFVKVRDHCHFTGEYRGAAHNQCNLTCRKPLILPVVFHNLQGYDAHLFIKQLAKVVGDLTSIPSTEEKYITFSKFIPIDQYYSKKYEIVLFKKFEIRFIDSFKFLQTSLSNLVSNLQPSDFTNLKKKHKNPSFTFGKKRSLSL